MSNQIAEDEVERGPRGRWLTDYRESYPHINDVAKVTDWWQVWHENEIKSTPRDLPQKEDLPQREVPAEKVRVISAGEQYRAPEKVGRNDPCPCRSGQKYKR